MDGARFGRLCAGIERLTVGQVRPVWPILASSKNQSSSRTASGWAAAISAISAGNFF